MNPGSRQDGRRRGAILLVMLTAATLAAGAFLLGAQDPSRSDLPDDPALGQDQAPAATRVAPAGDPTQSAIGWLIGYRSVSYSDPSPTSWIDRVAPVVTGPLAREYSGDRDATAGASWTSFVDQRCASTVTQPTARISPEAPRAETEAFVDVDATIVTRCASGRAPGEADEHISTTLRLERGPDRLWRVSRRIF